MERRDSNDRQQSSEETLLTLQSICDLCGLDYSQGTSSTATEETAKEKTSSNVSEVTSSMSQLGIENKSFFAADLYPAILRSVSFAQLSKRPLICPATKCGKLLAVTQIINHIVFEHHKIPSILTTVYEETTVDFDVSKISMGETVVLALLAIPRDMALEPGLINKNLDNSYVFLIFGAKQLLSSEQEGSLINIWVSGYVDHIFSCTVEVFADDRSISYNFHGAVNPLRESHDTGEILERADCLLLHPASIDKMLDNENMAMKLKVVIGCKGGPDY